MRTVLQRTLRFFDQIPYPSVVLTAYFLLTRLVVWRVRPMVMSFANMHFLDIDVLKHHLLHGMYYMHAQPPLFNGFLGLVLKVTPTPWVPQVFTYLYSLLILGVSLLAYRLMRALRVSQAVSFITTAGLMVFPSMIQAETWLYFSAPVAFLLILLAFTLFRALQDKKIGYGLAFLFLLSILVLTRSSYHLVVWMLPLVVMFLYLASKIKGKKAVLVLAACAVIVAILPTALYYRNYKRYGVFQSSTWIGFSAWSMTYFVNIDPPRIEKLIAEKKVTPLVRSGRYAPAEYYLDYYKETRKTGIDIWDNTRMTDNAPNFNHFIYPRADAETYRNSIAIIKEYPRDYWKAALNGVYIFFGFSPYRFFDLAPTFLHPKTLNGFILVYIVPPVFLLLYLWVVWTLSMRILSEWQKPNPEAARLGVCIFILFTMAYMTAQTILLVFPEANYIRIPMDPLLIVGLAMAVDDKLRRFQIA